MDKKQKIEMKNLLTDIAINEIVDLIGHGEYHIYDLKINFRVTRTDVLDDDSADLDQEIDIEEKEL